MFFKDLLHKNFILLWFNFPHHVFCAKLSSFLLPHVIHFTMLLKNNFIYLFLAVLGLCCCVVFFSSGSKQRLLSSYAQASHCGGFSCFGAWALGLMGFRSCSHGLRSCGPQALEHRFSSCGTWAWLLQSMWDIPRPAIKPMSLALAGGFFTIEPPGKPHHFPLAMCFIYGNLCFHATLSAHPLLPLLCPQVCSLYL